MQLLEYIRDFRKVTVAERVTRYESIKRNTGTSHTRTCACVKGEEPVHTREDVRLGHGGVGQAHNNRNSNTSPWPQVLGRHPGFAHPSLRIRELFISFQRGEKKIQSSIKCDSFVKRSRSIKV